MSPDLTTRYLGLTLANPLVVGACPLTADLNTLRRLEDAGAAAVVLPSLFEEQIAHESGVAATNGKSPAASGLYQIPGAANFSLGPDSCLRHIELAKKTLSIPVIASLNGATHGGWTRFAKLIEQAGADALELNIYFIATELDTTAEQVETRYAEIVAAARAATSIPLAVKIGPYFTSLPNVAKRLVDAGANGLVLFNRFLDPEFDLNKFEVQPHLELSNRGEQRLPLRWIAILSGRIGASLAATSGIQDGRDVIRTLAAGADAAMIVSALVRHGPDHLHRVREELTRWLEQRDYHSVDQFKGLMNRANYLDPTAFERANYMQALSSFVKAFQEQTP